MILTFIIYLLLATEISTRYIQLCDEYRRYVVRNRVVKVFSGFGTSFLLDSEGNINPYGKNEKGQLGIPGYESFVTVYVREVLDELQGLEIKKICSGDEFSVVLSQSGQVFTFGSNKEGNLGLNILSSEFYNYEPTLVDFSELFYAELIVDISCGFGHVVALTSSGSVVGWGRNTEGQLDSSFNSHFMPVFLNFSSIESIFTGFYHTCVKSRYETFCFGDNRKGQIGIGSSSEYVGKTNITEYLIETNGDVLSSIFTPGENTFVVTMDGKLLGTGSNLIGELGSMDEYGSFSPSFVEIDFSDFNPLDISKIENNKNFERPANLFLLSTNEIFSLGSQPCLDSEFRYNSTFTRVISGNLFSDVSAMSEQILLLQSITCQSSTEIYVVDTNLDVCSGVEAGICEENDQCRCTPSYISNNCNERVNISGKTVFSTGINEFGSNADRSLETRDHSDIREVNRNNSIFGADITKVVSGENFQLFFSKQESKVFSVGMGRDGQLGDGYLFDRNTVREMDQIFDVVSICSGKTESIGLSSDGTLFGFGKATHGYFGSGIFSEYIVPTRLPVNDFFGLMKVTSFACGGSHSFVVLENGVVFGSGRNDLGQLGNSLDYDDHAYPLRIEEQLGYIVEESYLKYTPENSNYLNKEQLNEEKRIFYSRNLRIKSGYDHSCFLNIDQELYCWGSNEFGQLCNNSCSFTNTPILISKEVSKFFPVGDSMYFVVKSEEDGNSLYSCGRNEDGQLGLGNTTENQFSPQIVPLFLVDGDEIIDIQSSSSHSLLLFRNGSVFGSGRLFDYKGNEKTRDEIPIVPFFTMILGQLSNINVTSISARSYGSSFVNGYHCFGISDSEIDLVCSGRGTCIGIDICDCDDGYAGTDCSLFICDGEYSSSESACSGNGECVYPNTCSCKEDSEISFDEYCKEIEVIQIKERPVTAEIVVLSTLSCLCLCCCFCCLCCILLWREILLKFRKRRRKSKRDTNEMKNRIGEM